MISRSTAQTAESYAKYRQRGDFANGDRNRRRWSTRKRSRASTRPFVNWRYIMFTHNDSDDEMALARRAAAGIGVDRLTWEITITGETCSRAA